MEIQLSKESMNKKSLKKNSKNIELKTKNNSNAKQMKKKILKTNLGKDFEMEKNVVVQTVMRDALIRPVSGKPQKENVKKRSVKNIKLKTKTHSDAKLPLQKKKTILKVNLPNVELKNERNIVVQTVVKDKLIPPGSGKHLKNIKKGSRRKMKLKTKNNSDAKLALQRKKNISKANLCNLDFEREKNIVVNGGEMVVKNTLIPSGSGKPLKDVKNGVKLKKQKIFIDVNPDGVELSKVPSVKADKRKMSSLGDAIHMEDKERNLTALLFSDFGPLENDLDNNSPFLEENSPELDLGENNDSERDEDDDDDNDESFDPEESGAVKRKAVWIDEDDENIRVKDVVATLTKARGTRGVRETSDAKYKKELEDKFSEVFGNAPQWAELGRKLDSDEEEEGESDMRMRTTSYLASSKSTVNLSKTVLHFILVKNLNAENSHECKIIQAIEFDKAMSIALVASNSGARLGAATLFQFDGKRNLKLKSIVFPNYPIVCAKFLPKKPQFVVASYRSGRFYVCDIETGKKNQIPLSDRKNIKIFEVTPDGKYVAFVEGRDLFFFDCDTVSLFETLSVPCEVYAIAFHPEAPTVYVSGDNGQVYLFDLETWRCFHLFVDDGCIKSTAIAVSPNGRLLACGSSSGIVNIYDLTSLSSSKTPIPLKVFTALVTRITALVFNPTSEILAFTSSHKENAIRLIHTGSLTVFANFPGSQQFGKIVSINFSPDSKYLAIGNNSKRAHLCRLLHY